MCIKDNAQRFGIVTKFFHWLIATFFVVQFYLVYRRESFPETAPEKLQYILLHKAFGMGLLLAGILFILWVISNKHPDYPSDMKRWEFVLAKITQGLLFLAMLAMPITGYFMSSYAGRDISIFGMFNVPLITSASKEMAGLFHDIHEYISYAIITLVSLHLLGALKHHFIDKNDVMRKMLPW